MREGYIHCASCYKLFRQNPVPHELRSAVVPLTTVLKPSPWYTQLYTYKRGNARENMPVIASLGHAYFVQNETRIRNALGGTPNLFTVVPSKRGIDFGSQPLARAFGMIQPQRIEMSEVMSYEGAQNDRRFAYFPEDFSVVTPLVRNQRVLLIEDAWVTGATTISAAGALLDAGAIAVAVLVLGRVVDSLWWDDDSPYRRFMRRPFDLAAWPR